MKHEELKTNDVLYIDLESRIDDIKSKKHLYVLLYRLSRILTFATGAAITILIGWKKLNGPAFRPDNVVLVLGSLTAFLAAAEGLFNFKEKAMGYDIFLYELRRLRDLMVFTYAHDQPLYIQRREFFFNQYQRILEAQKSIIEKTYEEKMNEPQV